MPVVKRIERTWIHCYRHICILAQVFLNDSESSASEDLWVIKTKQYEGSFDFKTTKDQRLSAGTAMFTKVEPNFFTFIDLQESGNAISFSASITAASADKWLNR